MSLPIIQIDKIQNKTFHLKHKQSKSGIFFSLKLANIRKSFSNECQNEINDIKSKTNFLVNMGNTTQVDIEEIFSRKNKTPNQLDYSQKEKLRIKTKKSQSMKISIKKIITCTERTKNTNRSAERTFHNNPIENLIKEPSSQKGIYNKKRSLSQTELEYHNKKLKQINSLCINSLYHSKIFKNDVNQKKNSEHSKNLKRSKSELGEINSIGKKYNTSKKLKYIKDPKMNSQVLFREGTANLIDYGDCHYKLDASFCYKNKKNIYQGYKELRKKANISPKNDDEDKKLNIKPQSKLIENHRMIECLLMSNKFHYDQIFKKFL